MALCAEIELSSVLSKERWEGVASKDEALSSSEQVARLSGRNLGKEAPLGPSAEDLTSITPIRRLLTALKEMCEVSAVLLYSSPSSQVGGASSFQVGFALRSVNCSTMQTLFNLRDPYTSIAAIHG